MILPLAPLLLLTLLSSAVAAAQVPIPSVEITVEGRSIFLAPADADAFQRRLNQPPLLDDPPLVAPPSYTVTTDYWDPAIRDEDDEPTVDRAAEYFPDGGFVRARQDGEDAWIVLDLRQRAILDRYISFSMAVGRVRPRPSALEMLLFTAQNETVGLEAGSRRLDAAELGALLDALAPIATNPMFLDPPQALVTRPADGYWLRFMLQEGRSQQYFVDTAAGTLTDALGTETYDVSSLLGGALPETAPSLAIEDEAPAGSLVWWPVALGAGAILIALAVILQRRARPQPNAREPSSNV